MKLFILFIALFYSNIAFSQTKNSIQLSTSFMYFPSFFNKGLGIFECQELSYERNIKSKLALGGNFSRWNTLGWTWGEPFRLVKAKQGKYKVDLENPLYQVKYKFYEIYMNYFLLQRKHHSITLSPHISVANGTNTYLSKVEFYQEPFSTWVHVVYQEFLIKKQSHFGAGLGINYDLLFWKQKIILGVNAKYSYFPNTFTQFNFGLHTGFNF